MLKPANLLTKYCSFSFSQRKMSFTSPLISPFFLLFSCTISYVSLTCFRFLSSEPHSRRGCLGTLTSTHVKNKRLRAGFRKSHRIRVKLSVSCKQDLRNSPPHYSWLLSAEGNTACADVLSAEGNTACADVLSAECNTACADVLSAECNTACADVPPAIQN